MRPSALLPPFAPRTAMRPALRAAAVPVVLLAVGCGTPEDPQLAMCQAVAKQLTGDTVTSWDDTEQTEGKRARDIRIAYTTTDERGGSIDCRYPIDRQSGDVATAPSEVRLDGEKVPTKVLLSAGTKASGELIAGTAAETVARSKVLADEAGEKAREVAGQAREVAADGVKALQEKLDR